jgi:GNAT superfamily N-acetyltransferase
MIITKKVIDLTEQELARCRELSYGKDGYMCDYIDDALEGDISFPPPYRYHQAILYIENDQILGWCLLAPLFGISRYEAQFYVETAHRRHGIGRELIKEANKWGRFKPEVDIDHTNYDFFKECEEYHAMNMTQAIP